MSARLVRPLGIIHRCGRALALATAPFFDLLGNETPEGSVIA
jgi:hypothetical protein